MRNTKTEFKFDTKENLINSINEFLKYWDDQYLKIWRTMKTLKNLWHNLFWLSIFDFGINNNNFKKLILNWDVFVSEYEQIEQEFDEYKKNKKEKEKEKNKQENIFGLTEIAKIYFEKKGRKTTREDLKNVIPFLLYDCDLTLRDNKTIPENKIKLMNIIDVLSK